MADPRKKCGSIYVKRADQEPLTFELFDSRQWPDKPEAAEGLFRVCVNGKWLMIQGRKYSFMTYQAAELIAFREVATGEALKALEQETPTIRPKQRLRWTPGDFSLPQTVAWAAASPLLGIDGIWRVPIYFLKGNHMVPGPYVPVDEIQTT